MHNYDLYDQLHVAVWEVLICFGSPKEQYYTRTQCTLIVNVIICILFIIMNSIHITLTINANFSVLYLYWYTCTGGMLKVTDGYNPEDPALSSSKSSEFIPVPMVPHLRPPLHPPMPGKIYVLAICCTV